ncbi:MAG: hypothetical protein KTR21_13690 [Rhodobacteraceae bacterium]|nr:hypothetical protein [Paracoccaceae bacterium]
MQKPGSPSGQNADAETIRRLAALVAREVEAIGPNATMPEMLRSIKEAARREEIDLSENAGILPDLMAGRRLN